MFAWQKREYPTGVRTGEINPIDQIAESVEGSSSTHSSWHKAVDAVDSKQFELLGMQWGTLRDHMTALNREHEVLHDRHLQHRAAHGELQLRVDALESQKASHQQDHDRLFQTASKIAGRLDDIEQRQQTMQHDHEVVASNSSGLLARVAELERQNAALKDDHERHGLSSQTALHRVELRMAELERHMVEVKGAVDREIGTAREHLEQELALRDTALERTLTKMKETTGVMDREYKEHSVLIEKIQRQCADLATGIEKELGARVAENAKHADLLDLRLKGVEQKIRNEIIKETEARESEFANLRHVVCGERLAREEGHESVKDLLSGERSAREAHEKRVQGHLTSHEDRLHGHFNEHRENTQALIDGSHTFLKEMQEKMSDAIAKESKLHGVEVESLKQLFHNERADRLDSHRALQDTLASERGARQAHEDRIHERTQSSLKGHEEKVLGDMEKHRSESREALYDHATKLSEFQMMVKNRLQSIEMFLDVPADHPSHSNLMDKFGKMERGLRAEIAKEAHARCHDVNGLRELLGDEKLARKEHHKLVTDLVADHHQTAVHLVSEEKAAREAREEALQSRLANHDQKLQEQPKTLMDRMLDHHQSLKDLVHDEKVAREAHEARVKDHLLSHDHKVQKVQDHVSNHEDKVLGHIALHKAEAANGLEEHAAKVERLHSSVLERVAYLEKFVQHSADSHGHETLQDMLRAVKDTLQNAIANHSKTVHADVTDLREGLSGARELLLEHRSAVEARFGSESAARAAHEDRVNGSLAKHDKVQREALDKHGEHVRDRLSSQEMAHKAATDALHEKLQGQLGVKDSVLNDAVQRIEQKLRDEMAQEKGLRENDVNSVKELVTREQRAREELQSAIHDHVGDLISSEKAAREARMAGLQSQLQGQDMGGTWKSALEKQRSEIDAHHFSLQERLTFVENFLQESAAHHGTSTFKGCLRALEQTLRDAMQSDAAQLKAELGQLQANTVERSASIEGRLRAEREMREASEKRIDEHLANYEEFSSTVSGNSKAQESLLLRVENLEGLNEKLAALESELTHDLVSIETKVENVDYGRIRQDPTLEAAIVKAVRDAILSSLDGKFVVDDVGVTLSKGYVVATLIFSAPGGASATGAVEALRKNVGAIKSAVERNLLNVPGIEKVSGGPIRANVSAPTHGTGSRFQLLDKAISEEAAQREKFDGELRQLIEREQTALDEHSRAIRELMEMERRARETHQQTVQDHLRGQTLELHGRLEDNKVTTKNVFDGQALLEQRVKLIERFFQSSVEGPDATTTLRAALGDIELKLQRAMGKDRVTFENSVNEVRDLVKREQQVRSETDSSLKDLLMREISSREAHEEKIFGHIRGTEEKIKGHLAGTEAKMRHQLADTTGACQDLFEQQSFKLDEQHAKLTEFTRSRFSLEERIAHVEGFLQDSADNQRGGSLDNVLCDLENKLEGKFDVKLHDRIVGEANAREADVFQLRDLIGAEKCVRAQHHNSVQELLSSERTLRESHEERVRNHMDAEREARDLQHQAVKEHMDMGHTSLHGRINDLDQHVRQEFDRHGASMKEFHNNHADHKNDIHERIETHNTKMSTACSGLRMDIEELKAECKSIWDAVDTHTHDMSSMVATNVLPPYAFGEPTSPIASRASPMAALPSIEPLNISVEQPTKAASVQPSPVVAPRPALSWSRSATFNLHATPVPYQLPAAPSVVKTQAPSTPSFHYTPSHPQPHVPAPQAQPQTQKQPQHQTQPQPQPMPQSARTPASPKFFASRPPVIATEDVTPRVNNVRHSLSPNPTLSTSTRPMVDASTLVGGSITSKVNGFSGPARYSKKCFLPSPIDSTIPDDAEDKAEAKVA